MDRAYLKQLILNTPNFSGDVDKWKQEQKIIFAELSINLNDTIDFLNNCSSDEFYWVSMHFGDLANYFRSRDLVECIERNIEKIESKFVREELRMDFEFFKKKYNL